MTVQDLCDLLQVELEVRYVPGAVGPWITDLKMPYGKLSYKESYSDCMERGCTGWGPSPEASIRDFTKNLSKGELKFIVLDPSSGERRKFGVPKVTYEAE